MKDMMRHTLLLLAFICAAILPQAALHAQQPGQAEQPQAAHAQLTPQQRQLFDYCFLEAERQKQKNELSAAYHLFDYCLHIDSTSAAVWNELSFLYIYIKENDKALHAMKKAVECAPDDFWLRMNLAKFHMASRDTENAIREMENIARLFPEKIEAQMTLIALYEQTNRFDKVIETLDTLEEKRGTSPETSIEKAKAYIYLQQPGKAADEIRKLAELYPEETDYRILLGNILMDTDEEEAVKIYREVLQSDPDNEVALYNIALYHKHAGQTELYNRECDSILANSKISTAFKSEMMKSFFPDWQADKDTLKMIYRFDLALGADEREDDAMIYMLYASFLLQIDKAAEAMPVMEKALEIDPQQTPARLQLISLYAQRNDAANITRLCEEGVRLHPDMFQFYFYLGISYYQQERIDEAIATCEKAKSTFTSDIRTEAISELLGMLGDLYHQKGDDGKAFENYDLALEYDSDNYLVLNNYAYFLSLKETELERAAGMAKKAVDANPDNGTYADTYAWILFLQKNYGLAKEYIDKAMLDESCKTSDVLEHAGDIYIMNNDKEQALEYWRQAAEQDSDNKTLQKKIKRKKYIRQ